MTLLHLLLPALLVLAPTPTPPRPGVEAAAVVHAWDQRRAQAWAAGDVAALGALYVPGSAAGRADLRMLRAWRSRDLRVTGMHCQLLSVVVRRSSSTQLDLLVTDRLVGGVAVGRGVRRPLPRDRSSTWRLLLVRGAGEWLVAQASPVRTPSSTVRSRNE